MSKITRKYQDKVASPPLAKGTGQFLIGAYGIEIGILTQSDGMWYWEDDKRRTFYDRPEAVDTRIDELIEANQIDPVIEFSIERRKKISSQTKNQVFERDRGRCQDCGLTVSLTDKASKAEFDHFIPVAFGGDSSESNVRALCKPCNRQKWHLPPRLVYGENWEDYAPGKPRPVSR